MYIRVCRGLLNIPMYWFRNTAADSGFLIEKSAIECGSIHGASRYLIALGFMCLWRGKKRNTQRLTHFASKINRAVPMLWIKCANLSTSFWRCILFPFGISLLSHSWKHCVLLGSITTLTMMCWLHLKRYQPPTG